MKKLATLIALFLGLTLVGCSTSSTSINTTSSTKLSANKNAIGQDNTEDIEIASQTNTAEQTNKTIKIITSTADSDEELLSLNPENQSIEMQYVNPQPYSPYPATQQYAQYPANQNTKAPQSKQYPNRVYDKGKKNARGRDNFVSLESQSNSGEYSEYNNNNSMTIEENELQISTLAQNTVNNPYSATKEESNASSNEPLKIAKTAGFKNIYFDFDKFDIRADMIANINEAALIMKNNNYRIRIGGNTDEWGTDEYNYALGLRRSNSVKNALVAKGVQANRILSVSYGESRPSCTDGNPQCWAQNRRATFEILQ